MDSSLLVSLRSYRLREGRDSLENFITEAFCWLLRHSSGVGNVFLSRVQRAMSDEQGFDLPGDSEEIEWRTQVQLGSRRPDMQVSWSGVTLIFEHKIWSGLGDEQIRDYRKLAVDKFPGTEVRVIAITASSQERSGEADANLCWRDVYKALEQDMGNLVDVTERLYTADFLALLAHEGLHPAAPVSHEAIRYFPSAGKLPQQLEQAFTPLLERDWPVAACYEPRAKGMRWGRLGIDFCRTDAKLEWSPGIFFGSVLDGRDHRIDHRLEGSVKLQVILDFDKSLHRDYPTMDSYQTLKAVLAGLPGDSRWTFYDHRQEMKPNLFHPLYLEIPLLDLLRGSSTMEEQRERIHDAGCEVLRLLNLGGSLDRLMDECDAR